MHLSINIEQAKEVKNTDFEREDSVSTIELERGDARLRDGAGKEGRTVTMEKNNPGREQNYRLRGNRSKMTNTAPLFEHRRLRTETRTAKSPVKVSIMTIGAKSCVRSGGGRAHLERGEQTPGP